MPLTIASPSAAMLLKESTHLAPTEAEDLLRPRLEAISSAEDYLEILQSLYGFYRPMEQAVASIISEDILPDILERRNSRFLLEDMQALTGAPASVLPLASIVKPVTLPSALGCLYVMEGSTLGGRVITRMLSQNAFIPRQALRFFQGYGPETGRKWTAFLSVMDQYTSESGEMTAAANETFRLFSAWMRNTLYHQ